MTARQALAWIRKQGIVRNAGHGSLVEAIAGASIRGSWWTHPEAHRIFRVLTAVHDSPDVVACRLLDGRITLVHRRLWPALVRAAGDFDRLHLARVRQEHTASGAHRNVVTPFPKWVPSDARTAAKRLSLEDARAQLATPRAGFQPSTPRRPGSAPQPLTPRRSRRRAAARAKA